MNYSPFGPLFATVTLDGAGSGAVRFAPAGEQWEVLNISVKCSTAVNESTAQVYIGQIGQLYRHSGTYAGSTGDNNTLEQPIILTDGQPLYVAWTGGDVGATATATLSGNRTVPNRGFRA